MSDKKIVIVTEANERVATGHLMECIICAEIVLDNGYYVSFWINSDADIRLKSRIPCEYSEYEKNIETDYNSLISEIRKINPCIIIFNLRKVSGEFIFKIKEQTMCKIMCIDEYGHRNLPADIIVNPMINPYYWYYNGENFELYCGAQYLILSKKLEEYHLKKKEISKDIKKILITMGGVDPKNYVQLLINEMPKYFIDTKIDVVLGGGYLKLQEIYDNAAHNSNLVVYENVSNLPEMMYSADLIVCAGGNTLHEAACIGVPAIIIPSMPHEVYTASCFEKGGFGFVVNNNTIKDDLSTICMKIKDIKIRKHMSENGKKISDGLGRKRVYDIIERVNRSLL